MKAPKNTNFQDRLTAAAKAKTAMREKFQARPGPDDPAVIERQATQMAIAAARDARAQERKLAREAEAARQAIEKAAQAAELHAKAEEEVARAARRAAEAAAVAAERKAARDERYAARQARRR
jgi:hypothetical protein